MFYGPCRNVGICQNHNLLLKVRFSCRLWAKVKITLQQAVWLRFHTTKTIGELMK